MSYGVAVNDLNKIISRNASLAFDRAAKMPVGEFDRPMNRAELSRRMTRRLHPDLDEHESPDRFEEKRKSLYRTLADLLSGRRRWRTDYIEAFCDSVGTFPQRLVSPDYDEGKVSEAHAARLLGQALGRRLDGLRARRLTKNLNAGLDHPEMFDLIMEVAEAILASPDAERADSRCGEILRTRSAAFAYKIPTDKRNQK